MPTVAFQPADNLDFAWDRPETAASLRVRLAHPETPEWISTVAWLMREARIEQVWEFLTLEEVAEVFPKVKNMLGRRLNVWEYLLKTAHELGRI